MFFSVHIPNFLIGTYGPSGIYSCPFGECYRATPDKKDKNGKLVPTNKGRWVLGPPRTLNRCQYWYEKWQAETDGDPRKLSDYKGCRYPSCDIFDESLGDVPLIKLISPPPLHLLLGRSSCIFSFLTNFIKIPLLKVREIMPSKSWRKFMEKSCPNSTSGTALGEEVHRVVTSPVNILL